MREWLLTMDAISNPCPKKLMNSGHFFWCIVLKGNSWHAIELLCKNGANESTWMLGKTWWLPKVTFVLPRTYGKPTLLYDMRRPIFVQKFSQYESYYIYFFTRWVQSSFTLPRDALLLHRLQWRRSSSFYSSSSSSSLSSSDLDSFLHSCDACQTKLLINCEGAL